MANFSKQRLTRTLGAEGVSTFGGVVSDNELGRKLRGQEKYKAFAEILANTMIASAGVRFFLTLASRSKLRFAPAKGGKADGWTAKAEAMMEGSATTWSSIMKKSALYKFYGFSVGEVTAARIADGSFGLAKLGPRAQATIERWDVQDDGEIRGVWQRNPHNFQEVYIPRAKILYLVDDCLSSSPEGLGLFRHIAEAALRLEYYEKLEGQGFEHDLRGMPVAYGPFSEIAEAAKNGNMTAAQQSALQQPLEKFIKNHAGSTKQGLMLDSAVYKSTDEGGTPSATKKWAVELLKAGATSHEALARAIERINHEIARVLGTENMLLGGGNVGSMALSADKSQNFYMTVEECVDGVCEAFRRDVMRPLWELNGYPADKLPVPYCKTSQYLSIASITRALNDLARSGATMLPDDPAVAQIRGLMGIEEPDYDRIDAERNAQAQARANSGRPADDGKKSDAGGGGDRAKP